MIKNIGYPNGDVPANFGNNADMLVRAYRSLDIDLQQLVHEDMKRYFYAYPQLWNNNRPDSDIDHRRVQNLERFFKRNGKTLEITNHAEDYSHGDIIIWRKPSGKSHIGIIVPSLEGNNDEKWIVHNTSNTSTGPEWNDELFDYTIVGHYSFQQIDTK